ncbi:UDP-N-acetylmuramate dehydrogenase [Fusobacterium sp. PH5-44]|uniref:UDP-N-acetylmuramate dehydrogenase n=1 Tax=unclassified Fusobacterium TaxID=2648384 RepID=UPI003D206E2D
MKIYNNYSMKDKSNMKIGGFAKIFIEIDNKDELITVCNKYNNIFLIGNGTNTLINDNDLDTVFVSVKNLNQIQELQKGIIKVGAGLDFSKLMKYLNKNNYSGLENLAGIPGTVGGLVYMNGGAYGTEIFDCIHEVEIFHNNQIKSLKKEQLRFSYRHTEMQEKNCVIISTTFQFTNGFDLDKVLMLQKTREEKQPLHMPSLGSTFKNPDGDFAARLISEAGLKGTIIGDAQISEKHPNFLLNLGNASFQDIKNLLTLIKTTVKDKFNISLEEEIIIIDK